MHAPCKLDSPTPHRHPPLCRSCSKISWLSPVPTCAQSARKAREECGLARCSLLDFCWTPEPAKAKLVGFSSFLAGMIQVLSPRPSDVRGQSLLLNRNSQAERAGTRDALQQANFMGGPHASPLGCVAKRVFSHTRRIPGKFLRANAPWWARSKSSVPGDPNTARFQQQ